MAIITTILNKVPRPWLIKLSYWVRPFLSFYLRGKKYQDPIDERLLESSYPMAMAKHVPMYSPPLPYH